MSRLHSNGRPRDARATLGYMAGIRHIATISDWQSAERRGEYVTPSLEAEGFIHCSTAEQAIPTANALFRGQSNLLLLVIDEQSTTAEIRYEPPTTPVHGDDDQLFPHLYGPLNLDAVSAVEPLTPGPDGSFALPLLDS